MIIALMLLVFAVCCTLYNSEDCRALYFREAEAPLVKEENESGLDEEEGEEDAAGAPSVNPDGPKATPRNTKKTVEPSDSEIDLGDFLSEVDPVDMR